MKAAVQLRCSFLPLLLRPQEIAPRTSGPGRDAFHRVPLFPNEFGTRWNASLATSEGGSRSGGLFLLWLCVLAISITGCTTKSAANAQAQKAYIAGQRQAFEQALQSQSSVTILGPVRNQHIPWTEDLTLAKALVAAEFYSRTNPSEILIVRQGRAIPVDVTQLLAGQDVPLQAGDLVNIR